MFIANVVGVRVVIAEVEVFVSDNIGYFAFNLIIKLIFFLINKTFFFFRNILSNGAYCNSVPILSLFSGNLCLESFVNAPYSSSLNDTSFTDD